MVVKLKKRKHLPEGSLLVRDCTCDVDPGTCVVHSFEKFEVYLKVKGAGVGSPLFSIKQGEGLKEVVRC